MNLQDQIKQLEKEIKEQEAREREAYIAAHEAEPETEEWYSLWQDHQDEEGKLNRLSAELDRLDDQVDQEHVDTHRLFVAIDAGSGYGIRRAWYELADDILTLVHEGDSDNLAGNHIAGEFDGMTLAEAKDRAKAENSHPVGHSFDGCHACTFSVRIWEPSGNVPRFLTYTGHKEPSVPIRIFQSDKARFDKMQKRLTVQGGGVPFSQGQVIKFLLDFMDTFRYPYTYPDGEIWDFAPEE